MDNNTPVCIQEVETAPIQLPGDINPSTVSITINNDQTSSVGNDIAFDLPTLTDVTPQLYKEFTPTTIQQGALATLTYTVTNTSELAAKPGWNFTDTLPVGMTAVGTNAASIILSDKSHRELVEEVVGTFQTNFDILCDFVKSYGNGELTEEEISDSSRGIYNQLTDLSGQIETVCGTSYTMLSAYLTWQLFGLSLIWLDGGGDNFPHVLKNAAAWIIFAYLDLTSTLQK